MTEESNFFSIRRSVLARKMSNKEIPERDLDIILRAGIRVPDHGALNPWRLKVIKGKSLKKIDEEIILKEFLKKNPKADKSFIDKESRRFQRASVVIGVISTLIESSKIPEWEMRLSSGAVCMNLLSCAQSLNYAAQWLTEWYSYNENLLKYLGGDAKKDKIAGFIYLGHKIEEPVERKRPNPRDIITFI